MVDDVTRERLAAIPDTPIPGRRVARELTAIIERRGKPGMIVSDHGAEFTSNAVPAWAEERRIEWHFITPGKPMQNGYIGSFDGRMRDELLNETLFRDLAHARQAMGCRRQHGAASLCAWLQDAADLCGTAHRNRPSLDESSARQPVAYTAPTGATSAEAPIATR